MVAPSLFLFALAVLFAVFEIEGEGKHGWGEKYPTYYRVTTLPAKAWALVMNKPLTGYHAALIPATIMIFLWPMAQDSTWSWHGVCAALAYYLAWTVIWDFSWFVLNPHYGVGMFRKDSVWWFAREPWLFARIPFSYCIAWTIALSLAAISGGLHNGWRSSLAGQAEQLVIYLFCMIALAVIGAPLFAKYYNHMRRDGADQRDQANIFHN